jgi:ABC-type transport system involved in multi-copper enzyme maturation permease subunit
MLGSVGRLLGAEMGKVWRTKFPYLGLAASALMAVVARQSIQEFSQPGSISAPDYLTASVNLSSTIVIPVFGTIFAAMLVASETSRGTLRTILTRAVTRQQFLTGKILSGLVYLLLLFAANIIPALLIARSYPLQAADDRDIAIPGLLEQVRIFSAAIALTLLPQIATVCFGFFVSVISTNVATAIGVALGMLLSIQPIKEFISYGDFRLDPWLFSSYYDTAMGIANSKAGGIYELWNQSKTYMLLGTSAVSSALFLGIGYWVFSRRDLNY